MPKVSDIVKIIEEIAPPELQCDYDNSGLLYGDLNAEISGILVTLDTNSEVIEEAIQKGCNMIIEHHPLIFRPIKAIDLRRSTHVAFCKAIKNDIAIYSAHTSFDFANGGLNDYVMNKLNLYNIKMLIPDDPESGRMGELADPIGITKFVNTVSKTFEDTHVAYVGDEQKSVKKVAVINGAGGGSEDTVLLAKELGADIFVTSELKYNVLRLAKDINYAIISVGHYDIEKYFVDVMADKLSDYGLKDLVKKAQTLKNPLN